MIPKEGYLTLRTRQEQYAAVVMSEEASLLALKVAQGKTTIAVEAIKRLGLKRTFIVAPRNTFSGWERTVRRQYRDYTDTDLIRKVDSTKSGKLAMADLWGGAPGYYFVTWEFMRTREQGFWDKLDVDVVILDEVHRMQNRKSKTWLNIKNVGKKAKRIAMSGTFVGNKLQGAWTTLRWLFPERLNTDGTYANGLYSTPRGFWNWAGDWLEVEEDQYGYTVVSGEKYDSGTMLSYYPAYMNVGDDLGIEEPLVIDIECSMNAVQKKMYKQIVEENIAWLDTPDPESGKLPMVTEIPMTERLRLRQVTLGVPSFNDDGKVSYDIDTYSSKLDESIEVLGDLPLLDPVIVFTHSREFALVAAERYTKAGFPAFAWVGGTSDKNRSYALEQWGKADGIQVIVAVVEAIAEGTDGLQDYCSTEFWLSESENMFMNDQARGRLPRPGNKHRVTRYRFIVPGTYDQKIIDAHLQRRLNLNQSLREGTAS